MKATTLTTRTAVLAVALFQLFPPSARASAQRTASDVRADRLPVSVSLPLVVGWAALAPHLGFGFSGVTLSAQVSAAANAGVTVRQWYSYLSRESCGLNQSECALEQQTTSLALLAHVEFYPLHDALFFVRAAAGTSWLREQHAADSVIHESRSWPLTVLTAAGWDIRVKGHAFATPLVEVLATSRGEPALRTSPRWITFAGLAVTIR